MMLKKLLFPLLMVGLVFWGIGCSDNATEPDATSGDLNLEEEFGGYKSTPENPGFDDSDLLDDAANDTEYNDEILTSPEVETIMSDTSEAGYYHLRIAWGRLEFDSTVNTVTSWDGSLSINRGVEIIRRVIRFEPGQDYIVPRTDRTLIEWVSKTTVHNDGLAVDIVIPEPKPIFDTTIIIDITPEGDTVETITVDTVYEVLEPVEVVFETGPYSRTFTLSEISALDTVVYLNDSNAVAFHGLKLDRRPCPRGFLAGYWGHNEDGMGIFRGVWMSRFGYIEGYLRGHYGTNEEGNNVLFGKWINRNGMFRGFIRGTFGYYPDIQITDENTTLGAGWFEGVIFASDHVPIGVFGGKYRSVWGMEGGFFQGRWKLFCDDPLIDANEETEDGF